MRGVNKVIIVGNVGKDPETRYTGTGTAISTFSIATSEQWKDKQTGEKQERTEWHRIKAFGKVAEIVGEYVQKGSQLYVEGKLKTEEYEKDGIKRYTTFVVMDQMNLLGGRNDDRGTSAPPRQGRPAPTGRQPAGPVDDDDEIPF